MVNKIQEASLEEMITCERLMMWAHIAIAPREHLEIYHKCILNELAERFTADEPYCDSLDQRHVFHKRLAQMGYVRGLVPGIFWAESLRSIWGRVILQHLGIRITVNQQTIKLSPLPVFMLPLNCVCCGNKLSYINQDNYNTLPKWKCSQDDKSTFRDCEKAWGIMKATFETALNAMIQLRDLPLEERSAYIDNTLPVILSAYHLLSRHLYEYDQQRRPYNPRYSLVKSYEGGDYSWFVPYLIYDGTTVTEETLQPMFKRDLIGKTIVTLEDSEGRPYLPEGTPKPEGELIKISQLKDFLQELRREELRQVMSAIGAAVEF